MVHINILARDIDVSGILPLHSLFGIIHQHANVAAMFCGCLYFILAEKIFLAIL